MKHQLFVLQASSIFLELEEISKQLTARQERHLTLWKDCME